MKMIRILGTRGLILATALGVSVGIGFASPVFAQTLSRVIVNPDGKVTYLGTLGGSSYNNDDARDINDSGQVVGISRTAHGYLHAFITGPNGMGMTDLGTLGGTYSDAYGINDSGQVVGYSRTADGSDHAFITGPNGIGMTDLGTLGGSESTARGINNSGQVVGASNTADGPSHAFITGPNGMGMTDLGTLGGHSSYGKPSSWAYAVNDSGQVVGDSLITDSGDHAFITGPNGIGMRDLGSLDGFQSEAHGINDSGQVVGVSYSTDGSQHAFFTGPDGMGMTDLNSIVDLPDGRYLSDAQGINNQGQVIATVTTISTIPEPASYALMLAGLGLVGFMARSKKQAAQVSCTPAPV